MKIKDFKEIIDKAFEYNPDGDIEIHYAKKAYELGSISQSGVLGNLYIQIGEVKFDEDWYENYREKNKKKQS